MEQKRTTQRLLFFTWIGLFGQIFPVVSFFLELGNNTVPYNTIFWYAAFPFQIVFWFGYGWTIGKDKRSIKYGAIASGIFTLTNAACSVLTIIYATRIPRYFLIASGLAFLLSTVVFLFRFAKSGTMSIKISSILYMFSWIIYLVISLIMSHFLISSSFEYALPYFMSMPFYISMIVYQTKHSRSFR